MSLFNLGNGPEHTVTYGESQLPQEYIPTRRELFGFEPGREKIEKMIAQAKKKEAETGKKREERFGKLLGYEKAERAAVITTAWGRIIKSGLVIFAILFLFIGGFAAFESILTFITNNLLISGIVLLVLIIIIAKRR